jgi:NhaA family Na+:H+ antiporter
MTRPYEGLLQHEAAPGVVLMLVAALSIALANTPADPHIANLLATHLTLKVGDAGIDKPLLLWINDGLMAVFFLLVGLEIKREVVEGVLSRPSQVVLPLAGALGGMALPAMIYAAANWSDPHAMRGWAIPAATDIAFSVGVLALLGSRVPLALRLFLLTLAIADDLGAIVVIAVFYTDSLSTSSLVLAAVCIAVLIGMNRLGVRALGPFIVVGLVLWVCVLKSGVHATLAGVVLAFCLPLRQPDVADEERSFIRLEHALKPWVAFFIMPLFAFANAGLSFEGLSIANLGDPIALGIWVGLFVGKQLGIMLLCWIVIALGLAEMPQGSSWLGLYGVSICAGIGFTMSLFVGTLAFDGVAELRDVRLGVITGSLLSALLSFAILRFTAATGKVPANP